MIGSSQRPERRRRHSRANLARIAIFWQGFATGAIILAAVLLEALQRRISERRRKAIGVKRLAKVSPRFQPLGSRSNKTLALTAAEALEPRVEVSVPAEALIVISPHGDVRLESALDSRHAARSLLDRPKDMRRRTGQRGGADNPRVEVRDPVDRAPQDVGPDLAPHAGAGPPPFALVVAMKRPWRLRPPP